MRQRETERGAHAREGLASVGVCMGQTCEGKQLDASDTSAALSVCQSVVPPCVHGPRSYRGDVHHSVTRNKQGALCAFARGGRAEDGDDEGGSRHRGGEESAHSLCVIEGPPSQSVRTLKMKHFKNLTFSTV